MNNETLAQMADILPLLPEPTAGAGVLPVVILVIAVFSISWLAWRHYRSPFTRLSRNLRSGKLSPREVSHQLAQLVAKNTALGQQLDHIRFRRRPPDTREVSQLMQQVRRGS